MIIRLENNNYDNTNDAIEAAIEIANKLDVGVVFSDEDSGKDLEVYPEATVYSVLKYHGIKE